MGREMVRGMGWDGKRSGSRRKKRREKHKSKHDKNNTKTNAMNPDCYGKAKSHPHNKLNQA